MIYPINHLPDRIPVGVQTENGVEVIGFDIKPWADVFPDMHFSVWHTRPGENEAYPVSDHMIVGTVLYWHPDGYDTAVAGEGKVEIAGIGENLRKLSGFVPTSIPATSLATTKMPGESVAPWYEAILNAAHEVKNAVDVGSGALYLVTPVSKGGTWCADRTQDEIRAAVAARKTCLLVSTKGEVYTYWGEKDYFLPSAGETDCPTFVRYEDVPGTGIVMNEAQVFSTGRISYSNSGASRTPNPRTLTLTGAASATYDGSKEVTVKIPDIPEDVKKLFVVTVTGLLSDRSQEEIRAAVNAGKLCILVYDDETVYTYAGETNDSIYNEKDCPTFTRTEYKAGTGILAHFVRVYSDGRAIGGYQTAQTPNPKSLTFTGAVNAKYYGGQAVSVEIPVIPEDAKKPYVVTITATDTGWASDRAQADIVAAADAGKVCVAIVPSLHYALPLAGLDNGAPQFVLTELHETIGLHELRVVVNSDGTAKLIGMPINVNPPAPLTNSTAYQRWNGSEWEAATIAQLKADLGL